MARKAREVREINAGSMADIAFLLLIFFLVTTTMDTESGLARTLPPWIDDPDGIARTVAERNLLRVDINANNELLINGESIEIGDVRELALAFLENPNRANDLPEKALVTLDSCRRAIKNAEDQLTNGPANRRKQQELALKKAQENLGAVQTLGSFVGIHKDAAISLQNHRKTGYATYVAVQNELSAALSKLRDELALEHFGQTYKVLNENPTAYAPQIRAIRTVYPLVISEAEQVNNAIVGK